MLKISRIKSYECYEACEIETNRTIDIIIENVLNNLKYSKKSGEVLKDIVIFIEDDACAYYLNGIEKIEEMIRNKDNLNNNMLFYKYFKQIEDNFMDIHSVIEKMEELNKKEIKQDIVINSSMIIFRKNINSLGLALYDALKNLAEMRKKGESMSANIILIFAEDKVFYHFKSTNFIEEILELVIVENIDLIVDKYSRKNNLNNLEGSLFINELLQEKQTIF